MGRVELVPRRGRRNKAIGDVQPHQINRAFGVELTYIDTMDRGAWSVGSDQDGSAAGQH